MVIKFQHYSQQKPPFPQHIFFLSDLAITAANWTCLQCVALLSFFFIYNFNDVSWLNFRIRCFGCFITKRDESAVNFARGFRQSLFDFDNHSAEICVCCVEGDGSRKQHFYFWRVISWFANQNSCSTEKPDLKPIDLVHRHTDLFLFLFFIPLLSIQHFVQNNHLIIMDSMPQIISIFK